jgi:hypothetical protein
MCIHVFSPSQPVALPLLHVSSLMLLLLPLPLLLLCLPSWCAGGASQVAQCELSADSHLLC